MTGPAHLKICGPWSQFAVPCPWQTCGLPEMPPSIASISTASRTHGAKSLMDGSLLRGHYHSMVTSPVHWRPSGQRGRRRRKEGDRSRRTRTRTTAGPEPTGRPAGQQTSQPARPEASTARARAPPSATQRRAASAVCRRVWQCFDTVRHGASAAGLVASGLCHGRAAHPVGRGRAAATPRRQQRPALL